MIFLANIGRESGAESGPAIWQTWFGLNSLCPTRSRCPAKSGHINVVSFFGIFVGDLWGNSFGGFRDF